MATQTLREASKNIFPIRAADFFRKDGQINSENEYELFEDHWSIKKVAELLLIEAIECEEWLAKDLAAENISLDDLLTLDAQAIKIIFTQLYPLLEPILLRGLLDPFYDNADTDPQIRKERADAIERLNSALDAPSELAGETGTRTGKAPLFVRLATQRAEAEILAFEQEIVIERTITKVVHAGGSTTIGLSLATHLAQELTESPEVEFYVSKIGSLPVDQQAKASAEFEKLLETELTQTAEKLSVGIITPEEPAPLTLPVNQSPINVQQPISTRAIAGQAINTLFGLVAPEDQPVLVDQVVEILDTPVLSSAITRPLFNQDQPFQQLFAKVAIAEVIDQVDKATGQKVVLTSPTYSDLFTRVNAELADPQDNASHNIARTVIDSLPGVTTQQKPQVLLASQEALNSITLTQAVTATPQTTGNLFAQVTLDTHLLRTIGKQIQETTSGLQIQTIEQPAPLIIQPPSVVIQPTISALDFSQRLATHLFPSANGSTPVIIEEIRKTLDAPVIEGATPLTQDPNLKNLTIQAVIRTVTNQASDVAGQTVIVSPEKLPDLVAHVSDLLAAPNKNTANTLGLIVTDALPPIFATEQKQFIAAQSTTALTNLSFAQVLTNPTTPSVASANQIVLNTKVLRAVGKQIETSLKQHLSREVIVATVSPQLAQTLVFVIPETHTGKMSVGDAVSQITTTLSRPSIDRKRAEETVSVFGRFTGDLDPRTYQSNLPTLRTNAMLAIAKVIPGLTPKEVAKIIDVLVPKTTPTTPLFAIPATAISEQPIIILSQKLGSLFKQIPTSAPVPTGKPPNKPTLSFKQTLLNRFNRQLSGQLSGQELAEIRYLFTKPDPQFIVQLLDYLALPENQRGTIVAVQIGKRPLSTPRLIVRQSGSGLEEHSPSMAEILAKTPGLSKGVTLLQEIREVVFRLGTNSEIGIFIQAQTIRAEALILMLKGANEEDIKTTQDHLIQRGPKKNAEAIKELHQIRNEMARIRQDPKLSRLLNRLRGAREHQLKTGTASPIQTYFSRFNLTIRERNLFDPRTWQVRQEKWLRRIFGEGDIIVRGRITRVNRLRYYGFRLNRAYYSQVSRFRLGRTYLRLSRSFSQGGLEKLLKSKIGSAAEASFRKLAGTAAGKAAAQTLTKFAASTVGKAVVKALPVILAKLGITVAVGTTGPVGWVVAVVVQLAVKIIGGIFKGIKKGLIAAGKFTRSLLYGVAESDPSFDPETIKLLKKVALVLGIFVVYMLVTNYNLLLVGGAFLKAKSALVSLIPSAPGVRVNPNCIASRHLSEEVICKLSTDTAPCNNRYITSRTWGQVNNCFSQITLTGNKEGVRTNLKASLDSIFSSNRLQCVGFVTGIEAGLGRSFPQRFTATSYLVRPAPTGYQLTTTGRPSVLPGDIVIWNWLVAGHMAIVVSDNGGTITVAEANGFSGEIRLVNYPFTKLGDKNGNPDGILTMGGGGGGTTF